MIRVQDASNGTVLRTLRGMGKAAVDTHSSGVAMDAGIQHVAIVDIDGERVVVTDMTTAKTRQIPAAPVSGIAYVDDRLLIQQWEGALEIWDASGDRRIDTLDSTPYRIAGPAVGIGVLASKGMDDTLLLADASSGQFLGSLPLPPGARPASTGLDFSPDGKILLTATEQSSPSGSGVVLAWNLDPNAWVAIACTTTSRHLTPELWRHYVDEEPPPDLRCR
ncbi:hypothetical protein AB0G15_43210 [Streptosporangium sp. NPDC023825]|uniref:WD40 repeat domain-containing protein n=1 Tax=Streptosporangium sp. NPDC023825 TaxID=3154909 RepID=UPI0034431FFB